jgi:hypothetical protein
MHFSDRIGGILLLVFLTGLTFHASPVAHAQGVDSATPSVRPGIVRDLVAISIPTLSSQVPVWNMHTRVQMKPEGGARIVPPSPIIPGNFAGARFTGEEADWEGFDTLILDVVSEEAGQFVIVLAEYDNGKRENYSIAVERLRPGRQVLRWRLSLRPGGDLRPSGLTRDGAWNPDAEKGVHMILADYPRGFAIEGMRLEQSVPVTKEGAVD